MSEQVAQLESQSTHVVVSFRVLPESHALTQVLSWMYGKPVSSNVYHDKHRSLSVVEHVLHG